MLIDITLNNIYKILEFANQKDLSQKDVYSDLGLSTQRVSMYFNFLVVNKVVDVYKTVYNGRTIRMYKINSKGLILLDKLKKYNGLYSSIMGDISLNTDIFSYTKYKNKRRKVVKK